MAENNETMGAAFLEASESKNGAVMDVDIDIVAVLGTAELKISQILQLGRGAVWPGAAGLPQARSRAEAH